MTENTLEQGERSMKVLIVYDSVYGNTEKIAKSIAGAFDPPAEVRLYRAAEAIPDEVKGVDLFVVGAPTQGFRATEPVRKFLENLAKGSLKGIPVAAFDTRIPEKEVPGAFRFVIKMGGYAAPRIADALKKKGGSLLLDPAGFVVRGKEGPLADGEIERAADWAKSIIEAQKTQTDKK
jgi:flavodoxin